MPVLDEDLVDIFIKQVIDRYTACELVEKLSLSVEDIVDRFYREIVREGPQILEND